MRYGTFRNHPFLFVAVLLPAVLGAVARIAIAGEPRHPRPELVVETVNGVEIRDPYRWMEQGGPGFDAWARAEATHARATLDAIPGREALHRRIAELDSAGMPGISALQVRNGRWLYQRAVDAGAAPTLRTRLGRDGEETAVDLLAALPETGGPWSEVRAARVLSPDGRHLTFGTTQAGEANPVLRVFDLEAMRLLPDEIPWPLWADTNGFVPRWLADGTGFFYVRRPDADAGMDNTARARRGQVFLHRLGTPVADDRAIFGHGLTDGITETDTLYVQGEPDARWLAILRRMPAGREVWVVDLAGLGATGHPPARRIHAADLPIPGYGIRGDSLFLLDPSASRYRLVRYDLAQVQPAMQVVLDEQRGVLDRMIAAHDAVYATESLLSQVNLHVIDDELTRTVPLPPSAVVDLAPGIEGAGAWLTQVDWLVPRRGLLFTPGASEPAPLPLEQAAPPLRQDAYRSRVEWAVARDGERIPYTIVERAEAGRNGDAYVIMDGYGCFGQAHQPFHWPTLQAWLERGGAFVSVALRGGGDLGADWHRAGRDRNKPTSFEDAIDVAKHLVRTGVTRPGRIGVSGASCGGSTMGMAALEAPHLFGAAHLVVAAFDQWRLAEGSAAGARSIRDFGDPATAEGTRRILALSPYMQVLDGAPRPALLIGSGATDYTIPLWVGGKMVARSRAALPAGKPVLWKIEWEAGHSAGVDFVQEDTDLMAFMFWQLGHPDFQPATTEGTGG